LVEAGRLFVARPPLFSATFKGEKIYVNDMEEREKFEAEHPRANLNWTRFKGLGAMNFDQLTTTSMDPPSRRLAQINVDDAPFSGSCIVNLMGNDSDAKLEALQEVVIDLEEVL